MAGTATAGPAPDGPPVRDVQAAASEAEKVLGAKLALVTAAVTGLLGSVQEIGSVVTEAGSTAVAPFLIFRVAGLLALIPLFPLVLGVSRSRLFVVSVATAVALALEWAASDAAQIHLLASGALISMAAFLL